MNNGTPSTLHLPDGRPEETLQHINAAGLLREIYRSVTDFAIFTMDTGGVITTWNAGAEAIIGYPAQEAIGKSTNIIFTPEDLIAGQPEHERGLARREGRATDYRWHVRRDGSYFWADGVLTLLQDQAGSHIGYMKIVRDITDRKRAEEEIYQLANFDRLTGLANRLSFDARLEDSIALSAAKGQATTLLLVDLDRFKQINDTLGHQAGDRLLQLAALRMRSACRKGELIARLGGDEFGVLQFGAGPHEAGDLAARLLAMLAQPFIIDGREVATNGSIGIAVCPEDATQSDTLFRKADLALYRAKNEGRGRFHYFTAHLDAAAHRRSSDIAALRVAVERKEFYLEYQPIVDCNSTRPIGMEALLRCSSSALADRSIEEIVTLAVDSGLTPDIGLWVIDTACRQLRAWQDMSFNGLKMSVNLCATEMLDPNTRKHIERTLANSSIDPTQLQIEITERQAIEVQDGEVALLHALRERGIALALDDFGTGYSALSYLRKLPVTTLKLDKTFLSEIPRSRQSCLVTKSIIDLAQALNIGVVAEGVESDDQANFLREAGCDALQGFLYSRPLSASEMTTWLRINAPASGVDHNASGDHQQAPV